MQWIIGLLAIAFAVLFFGWLINKVIANFDDDYFAE